MAELMLTLAVIGILMAVGAPSFTNATKNARISADYNSLISALQLARSEAVKRNTNVAVCARAANSADVCGLNWTDGWLVFVDNGTDPGRIDGNEEMLLEVEPLKEGTVISAFGSANMKTNAMLLRTNIRFAPRGNSNWRRGGTVRICDSRGTDYMRALNITLSGDVRRARENQDGDTITAWGTVLECPSGA